jgi:toxin YhaV
MTKPYEEFHYSCFSAQYSYKQLRFVHLLKEDKERNKQHPEVKFFIKLRKAMDTCLGEPGHTRYYCGNTLAKQRYDDKQLGKGYTHWRRIKNDMPDRYRLFFQFSDCGMLVIFAWLNEHHDIRRDGAPNDVYAVFARLLAGGKIPNLFSDLMAQSTSISDQT